MNNAQDSQNTENNDHTDQSSKKPSLLQIIGSVLAAGFGVQSRKNRERDFKQGNLTTFVIAGIIFTVLFIFTVYSIVTMVLQQAK